MMTGSAEGLVRRGIADFAAIKTVPAFCTLPMNSNGARVIFYGGIFLGRCDDLRARAGDEGRAIRSDLMNKMIVRNDSVGPRHVDHEDSGTAGQIFAEKGRYQTRAGVGTSARCLAEDHPDRLSGKIDFLR